jgi:hypothetical protein
LAPRGSRRVLQQVALKSQPIFVVVNNNNNNNNNSVALVRERTIPTERPPPADFCGFKVSRVQRDGSLRPYSRFSTMEPLLFLPSSSSIVLTRLSGPRSRHTTSQKIW